MKARLTLRHSLTHVRGFMTIAIEGAAPHGHAEQAGGQGWDSLDHLRHRARPHPRHGDRHHGRPQETEKAKNRTSSTGRRRPAQACLHNSGDYIILIIRFCQNF